MEFCFLSVLNKEKRAGKTVRTLNYSNSIPKRQRNAIDKQALALFDEQNKLIEAIQDAYTEKYLRLMRENGLDSGMGMISKVDEY